MYLPAADEELWVGVVRMLVHVPGSRTLKDRRRAVQSLVQRIAARHHASVAEVGHLENPGAAVVAATVVANQPQLVRARIDAIRREAELAADSIFIDSNTWVLKMGAADESTPRS